jgi:hypothetical protein
LCFVQDEGSVTDSNKAFKALLHAMASLKQLAICRLVYRKGSVPRFVALLPQLAKIDPETGEVLQPPGLNMIFLPYADDMRNLRFEPTPIATDELIIDAKKIVEKLTVKSLSVKRTGLRFVSVGRCFPWLTHLRCVVCVFVPDRSFPTLPCSIITV